MAFQWAGKAAPLEHPEAQMLLGSLSSSGTGTARDPIAAYMWALLGAKTEPKTAKDLGLDLTAAQTAQARKLAREWKPAPGVPKRTRPWLDQPGR
jgi:TPR repeat protein